MNLLDVGAHIGETLQVAIKPRWGFHRIYCFEPAPACWNDLERLADHRVEICRFGLFDHDGTFTLHNPGSVGASISADKDGSTSSVACDFRDAATWFRDNIDAEDEIFVKLNVEGAEYEIIRRLYAAGLLGDIDHLWIHFDVRKVGSRTHLEGAIRDALDDSGVQWVEAERFIFGSVARGTRNWLEWSQAPAAMQPIVEGLRRLEGRGRVRLSPLKRRLELRFSSS